ncbi:MAG: C40 family peptidase [Mycobacteriaceae bacterium]|nr:C40 family peptidase [Mycobacteriaceae bacterium]
MSGSELELLRRAHQLFAEKVLQADLQVNTSGLKPSFVEINSHPANLDMFAGDRQYRRAVRGSQEVLAAAAQTDVSAAAIITQAQRDHAQAHELTRRVLAEAQADLAAYPQTAAAHREAVRRRVARLRAQRAYVLSAHRRARRHRVALQAMRYRTSRHRGFGAMGLAIPAPNDRAGIAVRSALSRRGCPYVWGATGPGHFDCSGLVQWSYAQAGVRLGRTTYEQIHEGIPVPRSQVRPGDLVFPHPGHVQLAIGNNHVVEAPYSGAVVRISPLGANVQIRRPMRS